MHGYLMQNITAEQNIIFFFLLKYKKIRNCIPDKYILEYNF